MEETKKCSKCGEVKALGEFHYKRTSSTDGLRSDCKICGNEGRRSWYRKNNINERTKDRERYRENRQIINTRTSKRHKEKMSNDPEYRKKKREIDRNWYNNNKNQIKAKRVVWENENRDKISAKSYFVRMGIKVRNVPQKLLAFKESQLSLKRALKSSQST